MKYASGCQWIETPSTDTARVVVVVVVVVVVPVDVPTSAPTTPPLRTSKAPFSTTTTRPLLSAHSSTRPSPPIEPIPSTVAAASAVRFRGSAAAATPSW
eukprot:21909-Pelagococcus_subviridis.AAC.1